MTDPHGPAPGHRRHSDPPVLLRAALRCLAAVVLLWPGTLVSEWSYAARDYAFEFPRDHYAHPDFKTEWWYFVGHLEGEDGERLGFQLTLFRQGLRPPGERTGTSRFLADEFYFGHFAVSDLDARRHHGYQRVERGSFDEAGVGKPGDDRLAWLGSWEVRLAKDGFRIVAEEDDVALDLSLQPTRKPVLQGRKGYSQKAKGERNASNYYSHPRLRAAGMVTLGDKRHRVTGEAWLDREWSTSMLGPGQAGWDWFALQFGDGTELMIYQMRGRDGRRDPFSSGTLVSREGEGTSLRAEDFKLTPLREWRSEKSGGTYPVAWRIEIPGQGLDIRVEAAFDQQEMALQVVDYWEGAVFVEGSRRGRGYLEMTGYAGDLAGLRGAEQP